MTQELLNKATDIYNKVISNSLDAVRGLNNKDLLSPEQMLKCLDPENRDAVKNEIVGIGGYEYIPKNQLRNRCIIRLSYATYQKLGVSFADSDYVESLTQMEESDAREWINR